MFFFGCWNIILSEMVKFDLLSLIVGADKYNYLI